MDNAKLAEVIESHRLWLICSGGERANLRDADLRDADLRYANLRGANLCRADLRDANHNYLTVGVHEAPRGALVAWKKVRDKIVKLRIPEDARRSCATTRKHRSECVYVLDILGACKDDVTSSYNGIEAVYSIGKRTYCHEWDENRWNECSGGIHWFLTKEEAESW